VNERHERHEISEEIDMPVMMIRYQVADEGVAEVTDAVKAAFAAVAARRPEGIRYEYYRRPGTSEFVALLDLPDGADNPLYGIEAARDLQAAVAKWAVNEPPAPEPLEVLGSYGFTG
jgi:hypothetical protein